MLTGHDFSTAFTRCWEGKGGVQSVMLGAVDSAKQAIGSRKLAIVKHIHLQITVTTLKSSTRC